MKIEHRANFNALISGLVWGLILSFAVKTAVGFTASAVIWYGGNVLALMLYPVIVSWTLRQRTGLWMNACFFSMWGGGLSVWGLSLVNNFQSGAWINLAVNIALALFVAWQLIPFIKHNYALESERDSAKWKAIEDLSFVDFLFCRFAL